MTDKCVVKKTNKAGYYETKEIKQIANRIFKILVRIPEYISFAGYA